MIKQIHSLIVAILAATLLVTTTAFAQQNSTTIPTVPALEDKTAVKQEVKQAYNQYKNQTQQEDNTREDIISKLHKESLRPYSDKQLDQLTLGELKIPLNDKTNFQLESNDTRISISPNK